MRSFDTVPLSDMIQSKRGTKMAGDLINGFRCSRNRSMEDFLRKNAFSFEKRQISRTFLLLSDDKSSILGYFSLGLRCLKVDKNAPISDSFRKKLNVNAENDVAQSYLLGQLCRADDTPKGLGESLIDEAIDRIRIANSNVGCRAVRVDCEQALVRYYSKYGFTPVTNLKPNKLVQMTMII